MSKELYVLGFTGTRGGLTHIQAIMLKAYFGAKWIDADNLEFHHGDCVGADAAAHEIAKPLASTIIHPPENSRWRAYKSDRAKILPTKSYLERNCDIVDACEELIACPSGKVEKFRGSGTWYTIRRAKRLGKEVHIIFPDGSSKHFNRRPRNDST